MKKENTTFKIIIDTNVWISFLIGKQLKGLHKFLYQRTIKIITSNEQISELIKVLNRPKFQKYFSKEQVIEFLKLIEDRSINIRLKSKQNICRDPKDNYLLTMAVDSKSDYIITGDQDLLILKKIQNTKIITISEFNKIMKYKNRNST